MFVLIRIVLIAAIGLLTVSCIPEVLVGTALAAVLPELPPGTAALPVPVLQQSSLVRRIQAALQAMSIYVGDVDGRLETATVNAIRQYQRRAGLPEDGKPSEELADHIDFTRTAAELGARLEHAKAEQVRAAELALAVQPETRALLQARPQAERADPTRDPSPCLAAPTTTCLLTEASESAKAIFDANFRDWALGELVVAWARSEMLDEAMTGAARISDPRLVLNALRDIASTTAEIGRPAQAQTLAALISDPFVRSRVLSAIAAAHARNGTVPEEILTEIEALARTMPASASQVAYLATSAQALLRVGAVGSASRLIDFSAKIVANAGDAEDSQAIVAASFALLGRDAEALSRLGSLPASAQRNVWAALVKSHAADAEAALQFAANIDQARYRAEILSEAAGLLPRGADAAILLLQAALVQAAQLEDRPTPLRSSALRSVASAMARAGQFVPSKEVAANISDHKLRAEARWILAAALSAVGDTAGADVQHFAAVADIQQVQSGLDRAWTLCNAVVAYRDAGDLGRAEVVFASAVEEARAMRDPWAKTQILTRLGLVRGVMH